VGAAFGRRAQAATGSHGLPQVGVTLLASHPEPESQSESLSAALAPVLGPWRSLTPTVRERPGPLPGRPSLSRSLGSSSVIMITILASHGRIPPASLVPECLCPVTPVGPPPARRRSDRHAHRDSGRTQAGTGPGPAAAAARRRLRGAPVPSRSPAGGRRWLRSSESLVLKFKFRELELAPAGQFSVRVGANG
jgi:hypothetical protein